jgi:hypothetical protein
MPTHEVDNKRILEDSCKMNTVSNISAQKIALEYLKRRKNLEKADISMVEQKNGVWVIRGTCPIDLEGHPWAEKFEVVVDQKGKVISSDFALL